MARLAGSIAIAVGPSTKGFWTKFNSDVKKNPPRVEVKVNPDLTRLRNEIAAERKRQELNAINLKVKLDQNSIRGVERQLRRVEHVWKGSAWSKAVRVNLYVAGAASLPSLISGLMSLTTAVTQLGRAALVLPGLFSGLAASVGTFALGIAGVTEAIKQSSNGMEDAAQKARSYERATRDLERSQRDVVDALKAANREIEDQKNKLSQNQLSVEQAQLNLRKANSRVNKGGFETNDDYRQAILDQKRAQLELSETVRQSKRDIQDYYDTAKKGATESETFRDSVDRLNTAIEDFTKSQNEAAGASEKFLQAMKGLSPNAKDFVVQVLSMKNAYKELQMSVSDKLFDGLGKAVTDLAQKSLPMLRKGMQDVASGLNNDIKGIIDSLGKDANANSISKIFERTAVALNMIKPGLDSVITGFLKLSEVGSRFLPRLATAFNAVAGRFERFIDLADKDGSLERWINQGLNLVSSLGRSLISIGSIFGGITSAYEKATGNIGGLATTVEKQLKKYADLLSSPAGQRALTQWITEAKDFVGEIKKSLPGIQNIFQAIGDGARAFAERAFPIFAALGNFLERNAVLAQNLFLLYAGLRTLKPIMNFVQGKIWDPLVAGRAELRAAVAERKKLNEEVIRQEKERDTQAVERLKRARELRAAEDANVAAAQRASAFAKIEQSTKASQGKLELEAAKRRVDLKKEELDSARRQAQQNSEISLADARREASSLQIVSAEAKNRNRIELEQTAARIQAREDELRAARNQAAQSAQAAAANKRNLDLISNIGVPTDASNEPRGRGSTTRGAGGRFVSRDSVEWQNTNDFYDSEARTRGYYSQEEGRFVPFTSPATGFTDRIDELKRFRSSQAALVQDLTDQRDAIVAAANASGGASSGQLGALRSLATRIEDEEANLQALNMAVNGKQGSLEEARRIAYEQTAAASVREADDIKRVAQLEADLDSQRRGYSQAQQEAYRNELDNKEKVKSSLREVEQIQSGSSANQLADAQRISRLEGEVNESRVGYARTQASVSRTNLEAANKFEDSLEGVAVAQDKAKEAAKLQAAAGDDVIKSMNRSSDATDRLGRSTGFVARTVDRLEPKFPRLARSIDRVYTAVGVGAGGNKGLAGRLGGLLGLLSNVGNAIAGVAGFAGSVALVFALDKLADAHQRAADRADYHRTRLAALQNQIDPTTGAVTQAAIGEALDQASEFSITGNDNKKIPANPITAANKLGISNETLGASLNPVNLDAINQVLEAADKSTLDAIRAGKDEQWNRFGEQLQQAGVTQEIYAKAINGDQDAVSKFRAAQDKIFKDSPLSGKYDPGGVNRKLMDQAGLLPDLSTATENLVGAGIPGVALGQYQRSTEGGFRVGGDNVKEARFNATLKPDNPFTGAKDAKWQPDGNGVSFVMDNVSPEQKARLEDLGASAEPTGNLGRYIISIGGDLLDKYVEPRGFASGGSVWGAGTATSDSIPAMLSNGEFVINAKSASLIGHDNLNRMNNSTGIASSPAAGIKKFAPGGPVTPYDPNKPWWQQAQEWLGAAGYNATPLSQLPQLPPAPKRYGPFIDEENNPYSPYSKPRVNQIPVLLDERPTKSEIVANAPLNGYPHIFAGQPGPGGAKSSPGVAPYGSPFAPPPPPPAAITPAPTVVPPIVNGRIPTYDQLPGMVSPALSPTYPTAPPGGADEPIIPGVIYPGDPVPGAPTGGGPGTPSMGQPSTPATRSSGAIVPPPGGMTLSAFAALADSLPYVYGGGHPGHHPGSDNPLVNGFDCSSLASYVANLATGRPLNSDIFGTSTQRAALESRGFVEGPGGPGDLTIGWRDTNGGHTSMTLPDGRNLEAANRNDGILLGEGATAGRNFPFVMHLPGEAINPALLSDSAPPLMPDISTLIPPPGAVTGPKRGRRGDDEGLIPGINAPIPGPYGDLPIEPMDLLKQIGEALLTGILGFFGIDASAIIDTINNIFDGMPEKKEDELLEGDPGEIPEENPDPTVDPGPDPAIVQQFVQAAAEAKARGDEPLARNLLKRAKEYQRSRLSQSAQPSTLGSLTLESSQQDVAKAILSEARSRGYTKEEAQAILSTAIGSSQLNPRGIDDQGNWTGIFPLSRNTDQMPGSLDPNQNIASFFDGMSEQTDQGADIWQSIFYASGAPGAIYTQNDASKPKDQKLLDAALSYMQVTGYARGGKVTGPGTGTSDSIPAMLSDGEFVMRADAVKRYGEDHLNAMNNGGLVRGYETGGLVIPEDPEQQKQMLLEAFRPSPKYGPFIDEGKKELGFFENAKQVWKDTSSSLVKAETYARQNLQGLARGVAPLVGLGDAYRFLENNDPLLKRGADPATNGMPIPGVADSWKSAASSTAPFVGAGPAVNNLLGINDDPRRRRNRFSTSADIDTGTVNAYRNALKDATQYENFKAGKTAEAVGGLGSSALLSIFGLGVGAAPLKAVVDSGTKAISRQGGYGAEAIGAIPRASRSERKAAKARIDFDLEGMGFLARRQVKNNAADLLAAFPEADLRAVRARTNEQMKALDPDYKFGKVMGLADARDMSININRDFVGRGNRRRLAKANKLGELTNFTPGRGMSRSNIFSLMAHEFQHNIEQTMNPDLDDPILAARMYRRLSSTFDRENPGLGGKDRDQAFADWIRKNFYSYSFEQDPDILLSNRLRYDNPAMVALSDLNYAEAMAVAFQDISTNGRYAKRGSSILFDLFKDNLENYKLSEARMGRTTGSILAARAPGGGLSKKAREVKDRFAGPITGAVGGDFVAPKPLDERMYNDNMVGKSRKTKWFGLPGRGSAGEMESMIANILARYNDTVGEKAWIRESGMTWYSDAREWFTKLMDDSGVDWTIDQAGAALAALSGNSGWNANMAAAIQFFRDPSSLSLDKPGVQAALRAIKSDDPMAALGPGADKWRHFAASILGKQVDGIDPVAVDRWAARAALGTTDAALAERAMTRAIGGVQGKTLMGDAYREAARRAGINSEQMQAVVWMHAIRPPEASMWEDITKFIETKRWPWRDEVTFNSPGGKPTRASIAPGSGGPPIVSQTYPKSKIVIPDGAAMSYWEAPLAMEEAYGPGVEDWFGPLIRSVKVDLTKKQEAALRDYSRSSWTNKVMRGAEDLPGIKKVLNDLIAIRPKMSGVGGFRPGLVGETGVADVADLYGQIIGTPMLRPNRGVNFTKLKNQDVEQIDQLKTMLFGEKRRSAAEQNANPFAPDPQTIIEAIAELLQPRKPRFAPDSVSMEREMLEVLGPDASDEEMQYFLKMARNADRSRKRSATETGPTTQQVWEDIFHGYYKEARQRAVKTMRYQKQARRIEEAIAKGPGLPRDMWVTRMIERGDPSLAGIGELSPANPGFSSTSVGISRSKMDNPKAWERSPVFSNREIMQLILLRKGTPGVWMGGPEREFITRRMMQFLTYGSDVGKQVDMKGPSGGDVESWYPALKKQQRVYGEGIFPEVMPDLNDIDIGLDPLMELIRSLGLKKLGSLSGYNYALDYDGPRGWQDLMAPPGNGGFMWEPGESDVEIDKLNFASGGHVRGPGSGTSDSIPALLSNGEFVIKADAVKKLGVNRLNAMNSIPRFAEGGLNLIPGLAPPPPDPSPIEIPEPEKPNLEEGNPAPDPGDLSTVPDLNKIIQENPDVAGTAKEILSRPVPSIGGSSSASARQPRAIDPRARLAPAPTSDNYVNPALAMGIKGAISTIGNIASTAAQGATLGASFGASAAVPGANQLASSIINAGTQVAGDLAVGAANVVSALLVGTVTPSETSGGYGAPLLPQQQPQGGGTNFQSIHNGNVVTNNLSEYTRLEERKRAQREAPFMNRTRS